jgi:hypothetical protein
MKIHNTPDKYKKPSSADDRRARLRARVRAELEAAGITDATDDEVEAAVTAMAR